MKKIVPLVSLVLLSVFLKACLPEEVLIREREALDNSICAKRGGDYDKCRARIVEEREACLKRWYALPPEQRTRITLHQEAKTPEIRACNALGV